MDRLTHRLPLLLAAISPLIYVVAAREGLAFTPDSWAYWEGSVSLISGCGLTYVGGQPVTDWPPLFTAYITAVQLVLGTRAGALLVACAFLLSVGVAGWTRLLTRGGHLGRNLSLAGGAYVTLFLLPWHGVLLSELLVMAVLPWLLSDLLDISVTGTVTRTRTARLTLWLTALLLTRHTSLAWVPPTVGLVWWAARSPGSRARAVAAASMAVTLWALLNWALGIATLARIDSTGFTAAVPGRIWQVVSSVGWLFATSRWRLDLVASALVLLVVSGSITLRRAAPSEWRAIRTLVLFACTTLLCLIGLAAAADPVDHLAGRFLLFVPPIVVFVVVHVTRHAPSQALRVLGAATLAFLLIMQGARATVMVWKGHWGAWGPVVAPTVQLSADGASGPHSTTPPSFPWIARDLMSTKCGPAF